MLALRPRPTVTDWSDSLWSIDVCISKYVIPGHIMNHYKVVVYCLLQKKITDNC